MAATPRRRRGSHDDIPLASHLPVDAAAALRRRHRRVARWLGFPSTERPSRLLQLSLPAGGLSLLWLFWRGTGSGAAYTAAAHTAKVATAQCWGAAASVLGGGAAVAAAP